MRKTLKTGAISIRRFRIYSGRAVADFGTAKFPTEFSDAAASALLAIMPELNDLADRFNVPRLRGFKAGNGNYGANQGDGVMQWRTSYINDKMDGLEAAKGNAQKLQEELFNLDVERDKLAKKIGDLLDKHGSIQAIKSDPHRLQHWMQLNKEIQAIDKKRNKTSRDLSVAKGDNSVKPSKWQMGDDEKKKPYLLDAYLDSKFEIFRMTAYHELGHHIHQYFLQKDTGKPHVDARIRPTERWMNNNIKIDSDLKSRQHGKYATKNRNEWFAENFAAYFMGLRDKVDPEFVKLIETMLNGRFPGRPHDKST